MVTNGFINLLPLLLLLMGCCKLCFNATATSTKTKLLLLLAHIAIVVIFVVAVVVVSWQ